MRSARLGGARALSADRVRARRPACARHSASSGYLRGARSGFERHVRDHPRCRSRAQRIGVGADAVSDRAGLAAAETEREAERRPWAGPARPRPARRCGAFRKRPSRHRPSSVPAVWHRPRPNASALPQTCLVSGFGHSCSHALLPNDPSHRHGSGRSTIAIAPSAPAWGDGPIGGSCGASPATGFAALSATIPSCSARFHHALEISAGLRLRRRVPRFAHQIVGLGISAARQSRKNFVIGPRTVQRTDQRLHDTGGAVDGAQIRPCFQRMRLRNMPIGET